MYLNDLILCYIGLISSSECKVIFSDLVLQAENLEEILERKIGERDDLKKHIEVLENSQEQQIYEVEQVGSYQIILYVKNSALYCEIFYMAL